MLMTKIEAFQVIHEPQETLNPGDKGFVLPERAELLVSINAAKIIEENVEVQEAEVVEETKLTPAQKKALEKAQAEKE